MYKFIHSRQNNKIILFHQTILRTEPYLVQYKNTKKKVKYDIVIKKNEPAEQNYIVRSRFKTIDR